LTISMGSTSTGMAAGRPKTLQKKKCSPSIQRRMLADCRKPCCSPSNMHRAVGMPLAASASYINCACDEEESSSCQCAPIAGEMPPVAGS
jgi:hypothetical protein